MSKVVAGRMTAEVQGDFVVFLIGMRINKPWKLHKWFPVTMAMGPMLKVLSQQKDLGLLSYHLWISPTGPLLVQYWRGAGQLDAFARNQSLPHRKAWRAFNRAVGTSGDVGIWHETFEIKNGAYEAVYANMPQFGLGQAGTPMTVGARTQSSSDRRAANAETR